MTSNAKKFILDVSNAYKGESRVDDKSNIIVTIDGADITISALLMSRLFNEYARTIMSRDYAIKKGLLIINEAVDNYRKSIR